MTEKKAVKLLIESYPALQECVTPDEAPETASTSTKEKTMSDSNEGLSADCVGCIWIALHLCALLFFFPALFVTIPLHLIFAMQNNKK